MEVPCDMPDLLNIFTKIVCDRKDYCFLCLRTSDERRLVKPDTIKNFMNATKVDTRGNAHYLCYLCERQASNALKLFRAAIFASSVGLILAELSSRTIPSNKIILETKYFKRILNKVQLSQQLTPQAIYKEVQLIRENNLLSETDTLVMDNKQIYESAPPPQLVLTPLALPAERPRCPTPSILPDRVVTQEEIRQHSINTPQESYVILDDEDDPLRMTNVPNNPPQNTPTSLSNLNNLNNNLVITSNPPSIIKFQDLLTQNAQNRTNFLLHPIFLAEGGRLKVPSLSAVIVNDMLVFHDESNNIRHSQSLNVNMDIVRQNLGQKREVFLQNCNDFQLPSVNTNFVNVVASKACQNDIPYYPQKKMRIDGAILKSILCSKNTLNKNTSQIKDVQISDISSDMDRAPQSTKGGDVKTDWEDKIPMDVISFVDAVDPNADAALTDSLGDVCNNFHVADVRSLANEQTLAADIIDLC